MRLEEPSWWYPSPGEQQPRGLRLKLASALVGWMAKRRFRAVKSYQSKLPVICVGNFTVGGTGKTPTTAFLVERLSQAGRRPVVLSRGYGGRLTGPCVVELGKHTASDVGDEPLLHAARGATVIARHRAKGAKFIEQRDLGDVIVMDDGLQNPSLAKDLTFALVDARRGFGNGRVMPAGPLRSPLAFQAGFVDCVIFTGRGDKASAGGGPAQTLRDAGFDGPILRAAAVPVETDDWVHRQPIYAYAAIANPNRFFDALTALGAHVVKTRQFPDHHSFSEDEAKDLLAEAARLGAVLVTTEKDLARLSGDAGVLGHLRHQSRALGITMHMSSSDQSVLDGLLERVLAR